MTTKRVVWTIIILGLTVWFILWYRAEHPNLDAGLNEYLTMSPVHASDQTHPYITGKIVIVDVNKKEINQDYDLGADSKFDGIRANSPQEVGTVIWYDCSKIEEFQYQGGIPAYQASCTITIIDKANNMIVGTKQFTGPMPPDSLEIPNTNGVTSTGVIPKYDIVTWILSLSRR
jgi:hypothetical protein